MTGRRCAGLSVKELSRPEVTRAARSELQTIEPAIGRATTGATIPAQLARPWPSRQDRLAGEGPDGDRLVVFHVEDGVQLRNLEQVVDLLGEIQELQFPALPLHGSERADQLTDT